MIYDQTSSAFLLKHPNKFEFFSYFGNSGGVTIPVIFGAKEWATKEEAQEMQNSHESLKDFVIVKRSSHITMECV